MTFVVELIVILLTVLSAPAQELVWEKANGPYGGFISAILSTPEGILHVGSEDSVYRSEDRGNTWTKVNKGLPNTRIYSLVTLDTTLYAGTFEGGVFRSKDGGKSWTAVNKGLRTPKGSLYSVYLLATLDTILYAGTEGGGIYRSDDKGDTWTAINKGLTNLVVRSLAILDITLYAGTVEGGVFRSKDRGNSWIAINKGLTNTKVISLMSFGTTLYVGTFGGGVFRSEDGGDTWIEVNNGLTQRNIFSLVASGTTLYAGTADGVFRSEDRGNTWVNIGLRNSRVYSLSVVNTTLYAGTAFTGTNRDGVFRASLSDFSPLTPFPWDVNSDGEVNIFDLVIVAKNIGQKVKEGDMNRDSKVDIFDIVLVVNHFGEKMLGVSPVGVADTIPPKVFSSSPKDGEVGIDPTQITKIIIEFDEVITVSGVKLEVVGGNALQIKSEVMDKILIITFLGGAKLLNGIKYEITGKAKDASGNESDFKITFETRR